MRLPPAALQCLRHRARPASSDRLRARILRGSTPPEPRKRSSTPETVTASARHRRAIAGTSPDQIGQCVTAYEATMANFRSFLGGTRVVYLFEKRDCSLYASAADFGVAFIARRD